MKKLLILIGCIISAVAVCASTCETRVDKKWDKTTQERVNSCLTEQPDPQEPRTQVVTTQIYSAQYPNKKIQPQTQPAPKTYKRYEKQTAYREYINQNHYPTLKNDFLPEQSDELAHETAREALAQQRAALEHQQAYEAAVVRQTRPSRKVTVVKSRRTTKPKTVSSANTQVVETHTVVTSEQPGTEISSYEEISTLNLPSASEIQKAKAIEQDPLAPLDKDDPFNELYLNDEVLGTSGFGYNDTDPALQP